jgi:hypothetical protein
MLCGCPELNNYYGDSSIWAMQVMAYQSWKEGMDVRIMHQMQKALPSFVLDSAPKAKPADSAAAPKRSAEAPLSEEGRSPLRARTAAETSAPAASASGGQGALFTL